MPFKDEAAYLWKAGWRRLLSSFVTIFGILWLAFEPLSVFGVGVSDYGMRGYFALVGTGLIGAAFHRWPRSRIRKCFQSQDTFVEISVGDLFEQESHLVIGVNDVFDTETGEIIAAKSVQGQFLAKSYKGDHSQLDADINHALREVGITGEKDDTKTRGKRVRYPLGTCLAIGPPDRRRFLSAYCRMGSDLVAESNPDILWRALHELWEVVRTRGQRHAVSMPIIGSDLARIDLSRNVLIKMIVISFVIASQAKPVAPGLTIVVHPRDLAAVDLYDVADFLSSVCK